jgi:hypothetical protein
VVVALALAGAACGHDPSTTATTATASTTVAPTGTTKPVTGPLKAPTSSATQDATFFTDVTEADPALVTYEKQQGNVALRALLTDGSAFCALLQRGGGVDNALVSVAEGARSDESETHLPLSVTTFNTIESVALLTLCPTSLKLLPVADQTRILTLGETLAARSG